jgi:2-polyprenyl-3-methyl-5-hydroxy-6-metoxy-1,4-benzoquinol methylase
MNIKNFTKNTGGSMENEVINYYSKYREENRFACDNSRRIEFLTTVKHFDKLISRKSKILDCAAGSGAYTFYLSGKGHEVVATDLTPRHIEFIEKEKQKKGANIETAVIDASDLSCFDDAVFDVVLNMGPFYHIIDEEKRKKCLQESIRVLKPGGLLVISYIPRLFVNQMIALSDEYYNAKVLSNILETGVLKANDPACFWTDSYYSSYNEMHNIFVENNFEIVTHFAQDGILPLFRNKIKTWSDEHYDKWVDYFYSISEEASCIDMSNHVVIIGRKIVSV